MQRAQAAQFGYEPGTVLDRPLAPVVSAKVLASIGASPVPPTTFPDRPPSSSARFSKPSIRISVVCCAKSWPRID